MSAYAGVAVGFDSATAIYPIRTDGCHAYRKADLSCRRRKDDDGYRLSNLQDAKYADVDCLHDGVSALATLRQTEYDLVITDWQMEPISGVELTKLIKMDARLSKVRIILITGLHGKQDEAWLSGADSYVTKPFEARDLVQKVQYVLSTVARLASW